MHNAPSSNRQVDATSRIPATGERALVLGGGGSAGNAWLIGVVAGLLDGGLDVTDSDLVIGTSAGSTSAAQVTSADPAELLAATLAAVPPPRPARAAPAAGAARPGPPPDHLGRTNQIIAGARDLPDLRRRLGAAAVELEASSDGTTAARWRATVAARLPQQHWPEGRLVITAVDAETGEPLLFDHDSGVDLADAIAASCASGVAHRIGDRLYIDGGYRRNADNADLATGYDRVLVLSPFGGRARTPVQWGTHLVTQVEELRTHGSRVETIFPDGAALDAFGEDMMDPSARLPAARAGFAQGVAAAERLSDFWR